MTVNLILRPLSNKTKPEIVDGLAVTKKFELKCLELNRGASYNRIFLPVANICA